MADPKPTSPDLALRKFLDVVADEAEMNAAFRNRLLLAIGVPVMFEGAEDLATISPVEVASLYDEAAFKRIYGGLKGAALKKILVDFKLASATEAGARGLKVPDYVDMLWKRTQETIVESKGEL